MVREQRKGVAVRLLLGKHLLYAVDKPVAIAVVVKDCTLCNASDDDMVKSPGSIDAGVSRHKAIVSSRAFDVKGIQ